MVGNNETREGSVIGRKQRKIGINGDNRTKVLNGRTISLTLSFGSSSLPIPTKTRVSKWLI